MAQNTNGTLRLKSHFISVLWAAVKMGFYICMVFFFLNLFIKSKYLE